MPPRKKKRRLYFSRLFLLLFSAFFLGVLGVTAGLVVAAVATMPSWDVNDLRGEAAALVYDEEGKQVAALYRTENRIPVSLEKVPSSLKEAFLATEDRRFYEHHGVDFLAIARAAWANLRSREVVQGGSTITQQLAKNAIIGKPEQTLRRKIQEAFLAFQLERLYEKEEIFEYYLNRIYFGRGAYGVQAAAKTYFGKNAEELTLGESAFLAGLVRSPATYSKDLEAARRRQEQVLEKMVTYRYITAAEAETAKEEPLNFVSYRESYLYPYYLDYVTQEAERILEINGYPPELLFEGGLRIETNLNPRLQEKMEAVYKDTRFFPSGTKDQLVESAMVVLDPYTGGVKALVGGREHTARRGLNRATQLPRQPGSAIKPVAVYAPAFEKGYGPASVFDDVPTSFGGYRPRNYDGRYRGLINIREAVRYSVNVVAVKTLAAIGTKTGYDFACQLGLPLTSGDAKSLTTAVGGIERGVTVLQLAAAYAAFANQGVWVEPHAINQITTADGGILVKFQPQKKVVMSPQTAYLITDVLRTVVTSGTGTAASLGARPVAGKTGTTQLPENLEKKGLKGVKDAWFVGYTPEFVGAVWMGYEHTDEKHYLRGVAGGGHPARIWREVMKVAVQGLPVESFPRPAGIVYQSVDAKSGLLPSAYTPAGYIVQEIFAQQNLPTRVSEVWVPVEVCAQSGLLATPFCPEKVTRVFLKRPPYSGSVRPADAALEAPKDTCTLHQAPRDVPEEVTRPSETPGAFPGVLKPQQLLICTDPRHEGKIYRANIPGEGEKGGCPAVLQKEYPAATPLPSFCPLPEHQVVKETAAKNGKQKTPLFKPPPTEEPSTNSRSSCGG